MCVSVKEAHNARVNELTSITDLIRSTSEGDGAARQRLFAAAYDDLRSLARHRLTNHSRGLMLDTTSLVHESFLRFASAHPLSLADRRHFLRYCANVMRSVIVDCVRERMAECRGGRAIHVTLTTDSGGSCEAETEILRIHEALSELGTLDPRIAQVVEMRYFAGMTEREIADALGVTDRTVRRDWEKARLVLARALLSS